MLGFNIFGHLDKGFCDLIEDRGWRGSCHEPQAVLSKERLRQRREKTQ